jgi:hypothetical protein
MTTAIDRVEEIRKGALPGRLTVGAGHLGRFWKAGIRCAAGWRGSCQCDPQTSFCKAKLKWIEILKELHGGLPYGMTGAEEYFVIESMTLSMIEASGLTVIVEVPGARKTIKFGGKSEAWALLPELAAMDPDDVPGVLEAVVLMQEKL